MHSFDYPIPQEAFDHEQLRKKPLGRAHEGTSRSLQGQQLLELHKKIDRL